jgi:hypothetical protein
MRNGHMDLLNTWGIAGGDNKGMVGHFGEIASVVSRKGDGFEAHLLGYFDGSYNVGGVSTCAYADGDIPFPPQGHNLFGEDLRKAIVIADAGEDGRIRAQGHGGKGGTIHEESIDKLCSEMLGLRCTASIAEEQELISILKGIGDQFNN